MKIAITGAFSYSGKYIAHRLLQGGEQVVTLTGHPSRGDPFSGKVTAFPLNFDDEPGLLRSLSGVDVFIDTYWIRFDRGANTQARAVENTGILTHAAVNAGVKRLVHLSVTNPSADSPLPYFRGKAANEATIVGAGLPYAILRPSLVFGVEDILVNNIAYLLRRFPLFAIPGDGSYRLQPVYVDNLAALAVDAVRSPETYTIDVVGPDVFTFRQMVDLIGEKIGARRPLVSVPATMAWLAAQALGLFQGDMLLTREEVAGLMANLLISREPPRGKMRLSDWLEHNKDALGVNYKSELARHYS